MRRPEDPRRRNLAGHVLWDRAGMDEQIIPVLRVANAADAVAWDEGLGSDEPPYGSWRYSREIPGTRGVLVLPRNCG